MGRLLNNILCVAPRVGAWIETIEKEGKEAEKAGRTPCGCVD